MTKLCSRPKDELERQEIKLGDFVTINDDSSTVEAYIVKDIFESVVTICYIELSPERDDIIIREKEIPANNLIYIGPEFVNANGVLWRLREAMIAGQDNLSCLLSFAAIA